MIDSLSKRIATWLARQLSIDRDTEEIYQYGLNLLLLNLLEVLLILLISFFLNTFYPTLIVLSVFSVFRGVGGGAHMSTPARCLLVGTVQIVVLGIIVAIPMKTTILPFLLFGTVLFILGVIIKWVPGGTEKKPLTEPAVRRRAKLISIIITFLWLAFALMLTYTGNTRYILAMILGAFNAMFLVTPIGYRFNAILDVKPILSKGGEQNEIL
ncbi:MAG: accessory gene regulator B family protein [Syntrophomonadaceae bacterium]